MTNAERRITRNAMVKWIPINMMKVSPLAQRDIKQYRIDKIVAKFDPDMLGTPTVNKRDGVYFVIDGQHRVEALRAMSYGDQQIQCNTYEGLSEEEEAEMFLELNDVLPVAVMDKHKVGVVAGRTEDVAIDSVVKGLGLKIGYDSNSIKCIGTLRRVYERAGVKNLMRTLSIIGDAFGESGYSATIIDGISLVVQRYSDKLDDAHLIERLSKVQGGVSGLLSAAEVTRRGVGGKKGHAVAATVVTVYNRGRSGRNLVTWFKSDPDDSE